MKRLGLLVLVAGVGCGSGSGADSGAAAQFSDAGFELYSIPSCFSGLSDACAADVYAMVQAQIDFTTSLFAQSNAQGGFLSQSEVDAGIGQFVYGEPMTQEAAFALLWVDSLLYPTSVYATDLPQIEFHVSFLSAAEDRVQLAIFNLQLLGIQSELLADGGLDPNFLSTLQSGEDNSRFAADLLVTPSDASPIDFLFTPNYTVVNLAQTLGTWWMYQGFEKVAYGHSDSSLPYYASDVAMYAAATRTRAATRCTEAPVSPACATVASYESQVLAPALDRLAAQVVASADAGWSQ